MNTANDHRFGEALHAAQGRADKIADAVGEVLHDWTSGSSAVISPEVFRYLAAVISPEVFRYIAADVERALREEHHDPSVEEVVLQGRVDEWRRLAMDLASKTIVAIPRLYSAIEVIGMDNEEDPANNVRRILLDEMHSIAGDILKKDGP